MKNEKKTMNARIWILWNSDWVKVTLKPGDELHCGHSASHEEGFSAQYLSLSFDGFEVTREDHSRGRDCDGYTEDTSNSYAKLAQLKTGWLCLGDDMKPIPGMRQPDWQRGESSRYDQFAEAAGY